MDKRIFAGACTLAIAFTPTAAQARHRHPSRPPKPAIRITGISVDRVNLPPGTKVTASSPVNACYEMGGASGSPIRVDVYVFLHAVGVPKHAPVTFSITTPWDQQALPSQTDPHPAFSDIWFHNRGHQQASIFGGSDGPNDYYTYDDEGTRGNVFNGHYSVAATAKVHNNVLHAHGQLDVNCF